MSCSAFWRSASRLSPALLVIAWLGIAEAAPPPGKPVFIHVQGLAPTSVGMNGFIVAGDFTEGGAFQWMPTAGVTLVGGGSAYISRDGKAMAGSMLDSNENQQPAKWEGGRSWRLLGPLVPGALPCGNSYGFVLGTSGDGRVVVGGGRTGTRPSDRCGPFSAFRWEESTGYVLMPSPAGQYTRAHAVSADGHVVVGIDAEASGFWQGAKWTDGRYELIQGPAGPVGSAWAVNKDGTLIAGTVCTGSGSQGIVPPNAWTWTASGGVKCYTAGQIPRWVPWLNAVETLHLTTIYAVSDDGRVMGGDIEFNLGAGEEESVVWFDGEPVFLRDYLRSHGYPDAFEGHFNTGRITGVSPDGRVLVGHNGGPYGSINRYGFMVILPELP